MCSFCFMYTQGGKGAQGKDLLYYNYKNFQGSIMSLFKYNNEYSESTLMNP